MTFVTTRLKPFGDPACKFHWPAHQRSRLDQPRPKHRVVRASDPGSALGVHDGRSGHQPRGLPPGCRTLPGIAAGSSTTFSSSGSGAVLGTKRSSCMNTARSRSLASDPRWLRLFQYERPHSSLEIVPHAAVYKETLVSSDKRQCRQAVAFAPLLKKSFFPRNPLNLSKR